MWKATATLDKPVPVVQERNDDDWDSDPNFVNNVSEKDQRWGNQKTIEKEIPKEIPKNMADLRSMVVQSNAEKSKKNWEQQSADVKKSYGAVKKD
ncbi:hypothetical protein HDV06_004643 [Boothiomyces sp. JEL0866]|nr:hypothetical protein HDV06_004643 [Boothiomyces sp. JEL0866]